MCQQSGSRYRLGTYHNYRHLGRKYCRGTNQQGMGFARTNLQGSNSLSRTQWSHMGTNRWTTERNTHP